MDGRVPEAVVLEADYERQTDSKEVAVKEEEGLLLLTIVDGTSLMAAAELQDLAGQVLEEQEYSAQEMAVAVAEQVIRSVDLMAVLAVSLEEEAVAADPPTQGLQVVLAVMAQMASSVSILISKPRRLLR
jgi:hypothetical protein